MVLLVIKQFIKGANIFTILGTQTTNQLKKKVKNM